MPGRIVHVAAPSRLHFGLFSFGRIGGRQFGGVGLMVDNPQLRLTISPAEQWEVRGPGEVHGELETRVGQCADHLLQAGWLSELPRCRVEIASAPRRHIGLGSGTQLALSVAAGLNAYVGGPGRDAVEFATGTGRGARSAIGIHGFLHGGLLVEAGKLASESLGPLVARAELPPQWRFILLCQPGEGLWGDEERRAFERLPPMPSAVTDALAREALLELLPAAQTGDFDRFSKSLYEFGHRAGNCFKSLQGGPYRGPRAARLVEEVRDLGIEGVGQSSWGPTVFALAPDEATAARTIQRLNALARMQDVQVTVAGAQNHGARIEVAAAD
jgi:beta-ribofuranosylaminobenzene 5'-phosphate synthase